MTRLNQRNHLARFVGIAVVVAGLLSLSVAEAETTDRVPISRDLSIAARGLGTLGGSYSAATGINDEGVVVGDSYLAGDVITRAFIWHPGDPDITDLGTLGGTNSYATGINNDGFIVGTSELDGDATVHAFLWDPGTEEMTDLGTLDGATTSNAAGINDGGLVVGTSIVGSSARAFVWDPVTEDMTDIGDLGGGNAIANAINDDGFVVGQSIGPGPGLPEYQAFVWSPITEDMTDLGTLGGPSSKAMDINADGDVVGSSYIDGGTEHAFIVESAPGAMVDLGTLGGSKSGATAINDDGLVVGRSFTTGNLADHAAAWDPAHGDQADLGTVGGSTSAATAINASGVIVGHSLIHGDAGTRATVWTPPFTDVPLTHPFAEDIIWLVDNDLATGYPDGTFRPGAVVTRQALAAFFYRLYGSPGGPDPTCSAAPFIDVPIDHAFCGEIAWAVAEEITTGFPDGTFRPGATVTRQAFTAFMYRLAVAPGGPDPTCAVAPFIDVPTTHPFCGEIAWAAENEITTGFPDGTFRPAATVTRQATAAFLHRFGDAF